jgi:hypothetical protein
VISTCPVCNRVADTLALGIRLRRLELALVRRANPLWSDFDGICPRCVAEIRMSARRLQKRVNLATAGFRDYARYYLTERESGLWNQQNSDMAKYRRRQILDRVSERAKRDVIKAWALFDANEKLVARCVP